MNNGQPTARPSLDVRLSADATCPTAGQLSFRAFGTSHLCLVVNALISARKQREPMNEAKTKLSNHFGRQNTGKKNGTANHNQFMSLPKDMAGMQSKIQANKSWCCFFLFMLFFPENTCDIFCAFMTELLASCYWNLVF